VVLNWSEQNGSLQRGFLLRTSSRGEFRDRRLKSA
jgi:hypothetical protein